MLAIGPAFGILNLPHFGVGLSVLGRFDLAWPLELGATYWFANEAELDPEDLDLGLHPFAIIPFPSDGSGATFRLVQVNAAVCPYEVRLEAGRLWACGGLHLGRMGVEARGFVDPVDESHTVFALEIYARWQYVIAGPLRLTYSAGLFVPLAKDRFVYKDRVRHDAELFQQTAVGGRVDLLIGVAL